MNPPRLPFHVSRFTIYVFLFTFLALLYSLTVPLFEGNDESWHYAYVRYIAENRALPRQPPDWYPHLARQEASQPPLYYLLAAALTGWVPQDDLPALYGRENPFPALLPIGHRDNQNHYIHTDAEQFPYRGAALAIRLARLLSVLFGAGTVWGTYTLARKLFPQEEWVAAGAAVLRLAAVRSVSRRAGMVANSSLSILRNSATPCATRSGSNRSGSTSPNLPRRVSSATGLNGFRANSRMACWTEGRSTNRVSSATARTSSRSG